MEWLRLDISITFPWLFVRFEKRKKLLAPLNANLPGNPVPNLLQLINLLELMKCYLCIFFCSLYTIIVTVVN